jgi:DNA-binding NarL/FixJ family response regulator
MNLDLPFPRLQREWYDRLKEDGFQDIEKPNGEMKRKNIYTISFQNRERIREFYTALGYFIHNQEGVLPDLDMKILTLYCEGMYIKNIALQVERTPKTIYNIIKKYQKQIMT